MNSIAAGFAVFIASSPARAAGPERNAGAGSSRSGQPAVLVADESPDVADVLCDTFGADYDVVTARAGDEALDLAAAHQPELILLSVELPGLDGFEVCRRLKADVRTHDIPVIFLSACVAEATETRALELGAIDFLVRPARAIPLALRVGNHLALKRRTDTILARAMVDGETGLGNRRYFEDTLAKEWFRAMRLGTHLSLALVDLDPAPAPAAAQRLKAVADVLKGTVFRPTDVLARYGRDRFAFILPQTDAAGSRHVTERARQRVEQAGGAGTVSIGLATLVPAADQDQVALLRLADARAGEARENGRNRVC